MRTFPPFLRYIQLKITTDTLNKTWRKIYVKNNTISLWRVILSKKSYGWENNKYKSNIKKPCIVLQMVWSNGLLSFWWLSVTFSKLFRGLKLNFRFSKVGPSLDTHLDTHLQENYWAGQSSCCFSPEELAESNWQSTKGQQAIRRDHL